MTIRKINAHLFVEQKDITVSEMNDLFQSASILLSQHAKNAHKQVVKSSNLKKFLFNAMKDDKSASVLVDEIDLNKGIYQVCKIAEQVGNKITPEAYQETYDFFIRDFVNDADLHVVQTSVFIGMNLFVTKVPESGKEQQEKSDSSWKENYIDNIFKESDDGYFMNLSIEIKGSSE